MEAWTLKREGLANTIVVPCWRAGMAIRDILSCRDPFASRPDGPARQGAVHEQ
jgi:hypothetical protein